MVGSGVQQVPDTAAPSSRPAEDPTARLFASRSVTAHVVRGVVGLALAVAAFGLAARLPLALLLLVPAVVAWRGCPTCWTLGLLATIDRTRPRSGRRPDCGC